MFFSADAENSRLKAMVLSKPDLYLDEYQAWFTEQTGKIVSVYNMQIDYSIRFYLQEGKKRLLYNSY